MTLKNPRINVTFEETTVGLLSNLARQEHKSLASLIRELTLEALDRQEDFYLSQVAEELDKGETQTYNHDDA